MSKPRSIEEVKDDIRERVGRRAPFLHADKAEAEEALAKMPSFDGETWAAAWNELGARWEEKAAAAEKAGDALQAKDAFLKSYGYYGIARHPFPSTPGKHHGYKKTREMFLAASKYFDIPVERVAIPLQGQSHRRSSAPAEKTARADDHALGRHRQLERRTPLIRRGLRQRRLGLLYHR